MALKTLTALLVGALSIGAGAVRPLVTRTNYTAALLPQVKEFLPYQITDYGSAYASAKADINKALAAAKITPARSVLIMSLGMLETSTLRAADRDRSKDNTMSQNFGWLNINLDLVEMAGFHMDPKVLNTNSTAAVLVVNKAIDMWGVTRFLAFDRGGRQAFYDLRSFGAQDFIKTIASIMKAIDADPKLMHDSRRVEIYLVHV